MTDASLNERIYDALLAAGQRALAGEYAEAHGGTTHMIEVIMERHYTHRRHSTWTANIPVTWLEDGRYFTEEQEATKEFDEWITTHGTETNVEYTEDGDPTVEDLHYDVVAITDITTLEGNTHG